MTINLSALQQQRRDTASNWTTQNPTLLAGEIGYETDTGYIKVGDGSTAWTSLAYIHGTKVSAYPLATVDIANDAITGDKLANDITIANDLTVTNNLTVNGTTTTIDTTTLTVEDKNIELGTVATPSDTTADGGGITLKGASDKTLTWANSTDCWTFNQSLDLPAGSASAPALILNGDVNSGLFQSAADEVAITTGGTQRVVVDSSGNVGIGGTPGNEQLLVRQSAVTNAPTRSAALYLENNANCELQFVGNSSNDCQLRFGTSNNSFKGALEYELDNDNLKAYTNGSERLRLDSSGNVGIGTSSPAQNLQIFDSSGPIIQLSKSGANLYLSQDSDNSATIYNDGAGALRIKTFQAQPAIFYTNNTERLRIDSSGNVGIGTSSPTRVLHVKGTPSIVCRFESSAANYGGIDLKDANTTADFKVQLAASGDDLVSFAGGLERLRIDSSGNVGIGTSSPVRPLSIQGVINTIRQGIDSTQYAERFYSGGANYQTARNGSSQGKFIWESTDGSTSIERMRIEASGKVGIGTSSPSQLLDIASTAPNIRLTDTVDGHSEIDGNAASLKFNADKGNAKADSNISFAVDNTERMRIDASGRLLVGTSSARTVNGITASIQNEGTSGADSSLSLIRNSNNSSAAALHLVKSRGTANGSSTVVQSGDVLGSIDFAGADGTDVNTVAAQIRGLVDGTPGSNDMPGRLIFSTTADGASSPTERMRISSDGSVDIGPSLGSQPTSTVRGFRVKSDAHTLISRGVNGTGVVFVAYGSAGEARIKGDGDLENTNNSYGALSDSKLKENIVDANSQWDDLKALQVRKYNFKAETGYNTHTQIGLVAQEVELVSPGLVGESIDEETGEFTKSVNYSVLYMKAVKALQEAMERIETLEAKVAALEAE